MAAIPTFGIRLLKEIKVTTYLIDRAFIPYAENDARGDNYFEDLPSYLLSHCLGNGTVDTVRSLWKWRAVSEEQLLELLQASKGHAFVS